MNNKEYLLDKLPLYNIAGKYLKRYVDSRSCTKLNDVFIKIVNDDSNVEQGDLLLPLLFNSFINDLVKVISILPYADNIVFISDTPDKFNTYFELLLKMVCTVENMHQCKYIKNHTFS